MHRLAQCNVQPIDKSIVASKYVFQKQRTMYDWSLWIMRFRRLKCLDVGFQSMSCGSSPLSLLWFVIIVTRVVPGIDTCSCKDLRCDLKGESLIVVWRNCCSWKVHFITVLRSNALCSTCYHIESELHNFSMWGLQSVRRI